MGALGIARCRADRMRRQRRPGDRSASSNPASNSLHFLACAAHRDSPVRRAGSLKRSVALVASLALVGGFLHVGVLVLLFRALADGPVSVAVAGAASSTVFLITWNVLAGEPWTLVQLFAGIGVFFGVAMATRPERGPAETRDPRQLRTTALLGLGAGFLSSVRLFLVQEASVEIGPGDAMVAMRFGAAGAILPVVLIHLRGRLDALRFPSSKLGDS